MNKTALLLAVCCCPIVGHAMTFDMRGGYKEASHNYESRFKMSQSFKSGYWLSMETDNKQGDDKFDQSTVSYNEIEGNYKYTLNPKITIQPGMIYHWSTDGAQIRPYVKFIWGMTDSIYSGIRFRYDWNQYDSTDLSGNQDKGSVERLDLYLGWQNQYWSIQDNPVFYRYVNDFHYNNGKKSAYENDLVIKYKLNKTWQPYVEWDYMEQQGKYNGESGLTENRFRVGLTINFE
ncbi:porin [Salmonella enterica subsp. houtenae]|uniref:Porin n=2 Tax=Salmonella enterica TaxID=28901 RepID=A0A5Y4ZP74_SALER|nr:oligogalacturonate-specific porin KdgM family protein [Salmonella enterica]EBP3986831.1 porin [Salmonella enterica subsp. enterica]ECC9580060.1 porin [Salmonella enterica subsp. houtenae]EDG3665425.1 porin [Salmonella enterica subsp. enterica serovar Give]HCM1969433.1 porin [Salmonella enterica subsp. houtenae serovar 41:z29:-]EAN2925386.1 porin [Salmonella enterica]